MHDWAGREEAVFIRRAEDRAGKLAKKIEDAGLGPLVLAERFVIHEQVAQLPAARRVDLVHPRRELRRRHRPLLPGAVGKAKRDVIAKAIVLQQQLQLARQRRGIDEGSAAKTQELVLALRKDT